MIRQPPTSENAPSNQANKETLPTSGSEPLAYSIDAACHQLGDIGKTTFYKLLKTHSIKLAKLGARSVIAREDLHRLLAASMAARS